MVKPRIAFTDALETVLARVWQVKGDRLDEKHIAKTREAVVDVRTIYRNKGERLIGERARRYSQSIDFSERRYRAGYIASFGERHAYLTYLHLKKVEDVAPDAIPEPRSGELTVTVVGAGAALELFGLCYYYNENKSRIRKLRLNLIERISEWHSDRATVIDGIIKRAFSKLEVITHDVELNLVQDGIINPLSVNYDKLARSDIILIYNVLNEITAIHHRMVWRNLEYILKMCDKRVLILLMEPSAQYTRPRVQPIVDQLCKSSSIVVRSDGEEFVFDSEPLRIQYENSNDGLNARLFKNPIGGHRPSFENSLRRIHLASVVDPLSPISKFDAERQYRSVRARDEKHRFTKSREQSSFYDMDSSFGSQKVTTKYLNEP